MDGIYCLVGGIFCPEAFSFDCAMLRPDRVDIGWYGGDRRLMTGAFARAGLAIAG